MLQESGVLGVSEPSSPQTAAKLRHLLDETADLIESPSFAHVVTLLNNEGFSTLVEQKCATDAFKPSSTLETVPQSFDSVTTVIPAGTSEPKAKLAIILAVMARQAHVIGNGANPPNEYLVAMEQGVKELDAFAAVVYSSNFDMELLSSGLNFGDLPADLSSSYATVLVEKEKEVATGNTGNTEGVTSVTDLVQSVTSEADLELPRKSTSEAEAPAPGAAVAEESNFEQAWGKAVEEKNPSSEE